MSEPQHEERKILGGPAALVSDLLTEGGDAVVDEVAHGPFIAMGRSLLDTINGVNELIHDDNNTDRARDGIETVTSAYPLLKPFKWFDELTAGEDQRKSPGLTTKVVRAALDFVNPPTLGPAPDAADGSDDVPARQMNPPVQLDATAPRERDAGSALLSDGAPLLDAAAALGPMPAIMSAATEMAGEMP